ncbi:MAG: hypothetical protein K0S11_1205 [Gammaproteobacteria bacterium]|jgi:hypothetical protein|nr:hypothetical protein [Gammaproteobacteria bacterium]
MQITILRPRLITGPDRLGVLTKLFKLIKTPAFLVKFALSLFDMLRDSPLDKDHI